MMKDKEIIYTFEREFGRILTPMEEELIQDWKKSGYSDEEIVKGLKNSVFNGVHNFKYINKILSSLKSTDNKEDESAPLEQDLSWLEN